MRVDMYLFQRNCVDRENLAVYGTFLLLTSESKGSVAPRS